MSTILDAFRAGIESNLDEDAIKLSMIQAGDTFKTVAKNYSEFLVSEGLVESKESKEEKITDILSRFDVSDEQGFNAAVEEVVNAVKGVDARSAAGSIRYWCRKNEREYFTKPKAESGSGHSGFAKSFYNALIENPAMTEDEAFDLILGRNGNDETSANVQKHASHYQGIRKLANAIISAHAYESDDSDEV
jgi:hypothetical protein